MATAKRKDEWKRTSALMVQIYNANGGQPAINEFDHYSPYRDETPKPKAPITELTKWAK